MEIDHIGYAVKKIEKAIPMFEKLGYQFGEIIEDYDRNIYISFGEMCGYRVELVAPMGNGESPVDAYLKKNGAIPYHICYRSMDFWNDIKLLEEQRFKMIIRPEKAVAFDGKQVVFMMNPAIGMIEIVEVN